MSHKFALINADVYEINAEEYEQAQACGLPEPEAQKTVVQRRIRLDQIESYEPKSDGGTLIVMCSGNVFTSETSVELLDSKLYED